MLDIDKKKFKAELLRVQAAKAEMEYIIAQRMEEVERLQLNIQKQEESEKKLLEKLMEN
jgi:multidrug resistance efflux pump